MKSSFSSIAIRHGHPAYALLKITKIGAKISDVHNINTRNRSKLIAPVTRLHRVILLWDNVYAFTIGSQKTSENVLYHNLKKL